MRAITFLQTFVYLTLIYVSNTGQTFKPDTPSFQSQYPNYSSYIDSAEIYYNQAMYYKEGHEKFLKIRAEKSKQIDYYINYFATRKPDTVFLIVNGNDTSDLDQNINLHIPPPPRHRTKIGKFIHSIFN